MARVLPTLALIVAFTSGCTRPAPTPAEPYTPLFAEAATAAASHPAHTLASEFAHAAAAPTLDEARARWEALLKRYPVEGEREDAVQTRYVRAAAYELARVYYLLGRRQQGDALMKTLDPLDTQ